jgi:hypothetical protein
VKNDGNMYAPGQHKCNPTIAHVVDDKDRRATNTLLDQHQSTKIVPIFIQSIITEKSILQDMQTVHQNSANYGKRFILVCSWKRLRDCAKKFPRTPFPAIGGHCDLDFVAL